MKMELYEEIKVFEVKRGKSVIRTVVSARDRNERRERDYRLASFRVFQNARGETRSTCWFGLADIAAKREQEDQAHAWILEQIRADWMGRPQEPAAL